MIMAKKGEGGMPRVCPFVAALLDSQGEMWEEHEAFHTRRNRKIYLALLGLWAWILFTAILSACTWGCEISELRGRVRELEAQDGAVQDAVIHEATGRLSD